MHLLDENVKDSAYAQLAAWRIRVQKIGQGVGRASMSDEEIIPLLHRLKSVTFFTHDRDYYRQRLCHARYCLAFLDVAEKRAAETIRSFLRHPDFRTWAQRKGKVIRVNPSGMHAWQLGANKVAFTPWPS
jgi:hypothetical protein